MRKNHEKQNMETGKETRDRDSADWSCAEWGDTATAGIRGRFSAGTGAVYRPECFLEGPGKGTGRTGDPGPWVE